MTAKYQELKTKKGGTIKAWVDGVPFDDSAREQLMRSADLPIIYRWIAAMPDVHAGIGSTVGSVIPTKAAIIPAAVGVDIGCGMIAQKTSLRAEELPDSLSRIRDQIERDIPVGFNDYKGQIPKQSLLAWKSLDPGYRILLDKNPGLKGAKTAEQLGTLGGGNHFIELCLDQDDFVWIMLHSGSRGIGNRIGKTFIELAKRDMESQLGKLPDGDLAYFNEGTEHFDDYFEAVMWAQKFARLNREIMLARVIAGLRQQNLPDFELLETAVNCHHNYVQRETHFGEEILVTRKGAVRAGKGDLGIIPGSMGARSFIVRGLGNPDSFHSCSHGAGRTMSRTQAKKVISVQDHRLATAGVECRKDQSVLDESPAAYKSIDAVIEAQNDLIEVVHTLKQVVCVKG